MSLKIKRPKGVTVFVIIGILDAIAMAIFLGMFLGMPDLYASVFPSEPKYDFTQDYAIMKFDERVIEFGIFVIVVDVLAIRGLLLAKPSGRKLALGCAVAGIAFNVIIFGIPGMVVNSILIWYLFRARTKEYYENKI
jgi:energy-converting hydrogenase Eha subunit A